MKIAEIRQIPANELEERIKDEVDKYNKMRINHSITPLENTAQIRTARRTIARMKTVLREIQLKK